MDWARDVALILTAIGGGAIGPKLVAAAWRALTGRSAERRHEADRLRLENDSLRVDRDQEAAHRRQLQETLSETRRVALDNGVQRELLPTYPPAPPKES